MTDALFYEPQLNQLFSDFHPIRLAVFFADPIGAELLLRGSDFFGFGAA